MGLFCNYSKYTIYLCIVFRVIMVIYIHGILIKIVTYINKRKLFMANSMKKPVIFLGTSLLREKVAISTDHIPEPCLDVQTFNEKNAYATPRSTRPCDVNISFDIDIEKTKDDGFLTDLFGASPVFDVKVQDRRENELIIPNAKISERFRVTRRIPRKLKKSLKKKYCVYWVQHHPNTETVVTINSQN